MFSNLKKLVVGARNKINLAKIDLANANQYLNGEIKEKLDQTIKKLEEAIELLRDA